MKFAIGLMLAVLSTLTFAQKTPLACQDDASAGLKWENGKWNVRSFIARKFVLVLEGKKLTTDSAAKAMNAPNNLITCNSGEFGTIFCTAPLGDSLFFSTTKNKGGTSTLFGSSMDEANYRDTVTVSTFTCTPF